MGTGKIRRWVVLAVVTSLLCVGSSIWATAPSASAFTESSKSPVTAIATPIETAQGLVDQGRSLYDAGRFAEAAQALEQAVADYEATGDTLRQAAALSNLSLAYQQLGQWDVAEAAIQASLTLLDDESLDPSIQRSVYAQSLSVLGRLNLSRGDAQAALEHWEIAADGYEQLGDRTRLAESRLNQAQALQNLGFYRRALETLEALYQDLQTDPASPQKLLTLRSLGDALRVVGDLSQSETVLAESLAIATQLGQPEAIATVQLSIGNTCRDQAVRSEALNLQAPPEGSNCFSESRRIDLAQDAVNQAFSHYGQAAELATVASTQVQAWINQLQLLTSDGVTGSEGVAPSFEAQMLAFQIQSELDALPTSRKTVYQQLEFVQAVTQFNAQSSETGLSLQRPSDEELRAILQRTVEQARMLGDSRAETYAIGTLGSYYEQNQDWAIAERFTRRALVSSQISNAADITYRWQWQLARIQKAEGNWEGAIAAYKSAIDTLKTLRSDLAAISPDAQFSFRNTIEPIHREFVALLLDPDRDPTQTDLEDARLAIESLQIAELDNFFREACLDAREVNIDDVDQQAAVVYPIILGDRLDVILTLPTSATDDPVAGSKADTADTSSSTLRRYTTPIPGGADELNETAFNLLRLLRAPRLSNRALQLSQTLYGWLIAPFEAELVNNNVTTLVFVSDGILRNIPMATLFDGESYLIEKFSIATTPGLQLLESSSLPAQQLSVLLGGISESRQDFSPLPGVIKEFEEIQNTVPTSRELLNQNFTDAAFQEAMNAVPFPVVHLATHGKFSSSLDNTFILTWEDRLDINELNELLQATDLSRRRPVELLVLSACETAEGDDRAALGLAGMAVRAGARSTIATLWQLSDEAAPLLMERFYQELTTGTVTKAEALRRAQLSLLNDPQFSSPNNWGSLVLVGNWI